MVRSLFWRSDILLAVTYLCVGLASLLHYQADEDDQALIMAGTFASVAGGFIVMIVAFYDSFANILGLLTLLCGVHVAVFLCGIAALDRQDDLVPAFVDASTPMLPFFIAAIGLLIYRRRRGRI